MGSCTDESQKSNYRSSISQLETEMANYASQIKSELTNASSFKMKSAVLTTPSAENASSEVSTMGGKFVGDRRTRTIWIHRY